MSIQETCAFVRAFSGTAGRWALALMLAVPAHAAPISPFVAVVGGIFDGPGNEVIPEVEQSSATGPLLLEVGSLPAAYGKFRAAFGSNGFEIQTTGGIDREVDGGSVWTDGFTVTGGGGSLLLSTRIQGTVSGAAEMDYGLFVSPEPFDFATILSTVDATDGFWQVQLPNSDRLFYTGVAYRCGQSQASDGCGNVPFENFQGPLDLTLTTSIPVANGQTIYVAALFAGGVSVLGGSESFFNSADFGITAPAGTTLESMSGNVYASAVPLPGTAWLLLTGVLGIASRAVQRRMRTGHPQRPTR